MAKNKTTLKKYDELLDDVDFSEDLETQEEEIIGFMSGLIEANNDQLRMAIELTKIIVEKSSENMNEKDVFSVFRRATQVVSENVPLKEFFEKIVR